MQIFIIDESKNGRLKEAHPGDMAGTKFNRGVMSVKRSSKLAPI